MANCAQNIITLSFANFKNKAGRVCSLVLYQCGSFDVWRKLRELRSATLGMESRKANISSFVLRGGSEVMFGESQNSSLHHEGGEILLPMVAESECTNSKLLIKCTSKIQLCYFILIFIPIK